MEKLTSPVASRQVLTVSLPDRFTSCVERKAQEWGVKKSYVVRAALDEFFARSETAQLCSVGRSQREAKIENRQRFREAQIRAQQRAGAEYVDRSCE